MKQKTSNSEVVTRAILKEELQITKRILKEDLQKELGSLRTEFKLEIKLANEQLKEELEKTISDSSSLVLSAMDPLLADLEIRREEKDLESYQRDKVEKKLNDHEKRLKKLETPHS